MSLCIVAHLCGGRMYMTLQVYTNLLNVVFLSIMVMAHVPFTNSPQKLRLKVASKFESRLISRVLITSGHKTSCFRKVTGEAGEDGVPALISVRW